MFPFLLLYHHVHTCILNLSSPNFGGSNFRINLWFNFDFHSLFTVENGEEKNETESSYHTKTLLKPFYFISQAELTKLCFKLREPFSDNPML